MWEAGQGQGRNSLCPQDPSSPGRRDARGGDSASAGQIQPQTNSRNQTQHSSVLTRRLPFFWQEFKGERSVFFTRPMWLASSVRHGA